MNPKEFVCIVCPSSCRLRVERRDGEIVVEGSGCKRGIEHGLSEYQNPTRMLTTTVAVEGGTLPRLPVIGAAEVPRARLKDCLAALYAIQAKAPVRCGDVVLANVCDTGVDVVASRSMDEREA